LITELNSLALKIWKAREVVVGVIAADPFETGCEASSVDSSSNSARWQTKLNTQRGIQLNQHKQLKIKWWYAMRLIWFDKVKLKLNWR